MVCVSRSQFMIKFPKGLPFANPVPFLNGNERVDSNQLTVICWSARCGSPVCFLHALSLFMLLLSYAIYLLSYALGVEIPEP